MSTTNFTAGTVIASDWLNDVDDITYRKSAECISVKDPAYGATGDGVTNDTAAIAAALSAGAGKSVYFPAGVYMCQGLTVPADTLVYGDGNATQIKKNANGTLLTLGRRSILQNLYFNGNGGTYTGVGIYITAAGVDTIDNLSWRKLINVDILNTQSYCLEFTGNSAGYSSQVINCRFTPTSYSTYAVKMANNGGVLETGGNRMFANCWSFAARFADLTDAENTNITGCHGFWPLFTTTTHKCSIVGGRMNLYDANAILTGTANVVVGATINYNGGAALTISSGATNCRFVGNAVASGTTITDNSNGNTSGNEIDIPRYVYTPTWAGSGGTPDIGNGSIGGSVVRRGVMVYVNMFLLPGSSTAFNTSTSWTFSVPYTASRRATGSAYILDNGTARYVGVAIIEGSSSVVSVYVPGAGAAVGYNQPMTWANLDTLHFDIEYEIQ